MQRSEIDQVINCLHFLSTRPNFEELVEYLSLNISPNLDTCSVSLGVLLGDNSIESSIGGDYLMILSNVENLNLNSTHPASKALKEQKIQFVTLENQNGSFKSSCQIPINDNLVLIFIFSFPLEKLEESSAYFECLKAAFKMYISFQSKNFLNEFELSGNLTPRQEAIYSLIIEGKSNRDIANELAYSISLIRQETMRIYSKLGVDGRADLRRMSSKEIKGDSQR